MDKVRLGTRGSKLALAQANIVKNKLVEAHPQIEFEIHIIQTSGDIDLKSPLSEIGGKGVFIKELEVALNQNKIDIAIHSLKDITSALLPGLQLSAFLKAEAVADVLILDAKHSSFEDLPEDAKIATGSLRRKALLRKLKPRIKTVDIRGNVPTRIAKLQEGHFDGVVLSEAGLIRLGLQHLISYRFDPYLFCPAPGQGVIALETRTDNDSIQQICQAINDQEQMIKSTTELAFLERVQFDCRAPLGLHAILEDDKNLSFIAFLANGKMDHFLEQRLKVPIEDRIEAAYELSDEFVKWREKYDKE